MEFCHWTEVNVLGTQAEESRTYRRGQYMIGLTLSIKEQNRLLTYNRAFERYWPTREAAQFAEGKGTSLLPKAL